MKKVITLILVIALILSNISAFALHETTKSINERYAACIDEAIKNTRYGSENLDRESAYIIEKASLGNINNQTQAKNFYVVVPIKGTKDSSYSEFSNGEYRSESIITSTVLYTETHLNTKIDEYIKNNNLTDVSEAVSTIYFNYGSRNFQLNTYRVISDGKTYFIPYYIGIKTYNIQNDEACALELGKAYLQDDFLEILKNEQNSYADYEAKLKAEEEAKKYAAEHPVISIDENGEEFVKIAGVNFDEVKKEILSYVSNMIDNSKMEINYKQNGQVYRTTHTYKDKQCSLSSCKYGFSEFIKALFEEIYTQADIGKVDSNQSLAGFTMNLRNEIDGIKYGYKLDFSVSSNSIRIKCSDDYNPANNRTVEMRIKNSDYLVKLLKSAPTDYLSEFINKSYDETTVNKNGNLHDLSKTDEVKFKFTLNKDIGAGITKEVSSLGEQVTGIFEKYKENKYKWVYVLTLSGDLGTISFYEKYQSSWGYSDIYYSNNQPVYFYDKHRVENGELVSYVLGKTQESLDFKTVFANGDISEVSINDIKCTDLKYTSFSDDMNMTEIFVERSKEDIMKDPEDVEKNEDTEIKSNAEEKLEETKKEDDKVIDTNECADALYDMGLFKGTDKGYELEKSLTREECATILVRLLGEEDNVDSVNYDVVFDDVDKTRWSYAYVMYCYKNNITKGTGDSTFSPDTEIDAEQFVTLLMRLMGYIETTPETALDESEKQNIIPGDFVNKLKASHTFTRGDMVQIVYISLNAKMSDETVFSDYLSDK